MEEIEEEYGENAIVCPFCKDEHTDDLHYKEGGYEWTCWNCGSTMHVEAEMNWTFRSTPLVDKREEKP